MMTHPALETQRFPTYFDCRVVWDIYPDISRDPFTDLFEEGELVWERPKGPLGDHCFKVVGDSRSPVLGTDAWLIYSPDTTPENVQLLKKWARDVVQGYVSTYVGVCSVEVPFEEGKSISTPVETLHGIDAMSPSEALTLFQDNFPSPQLTEGEVRRAMTEIKKAAESVIESQKLRVARIQQLLGDVEDV